MSRTVLCRKYQQELPGLAAPPFPGKRGQEIFESVSIKAWQEWQSLQTMLINEKRLNLMDSQSREFLNNEMDKFFKNELTEQPDGYNPLP